MFLVIREIPSARGNNATAIAQVVPLTGELTISPPTAMLASSTRLQVAGTNRTVDAPIRLSHMSRHAC